MATFDQYLQNHLADVAAGRVMRLPDATMRRRFNGDWSGGLNASEMFRDQSNTLNRAPDPSVYNRAPVSVPQSQAQQMPVQPQPVGQATTFTGNTGQPMASQAPVQQSLPQGGANPAAVSSMAPQNSSTGTAFGQNYGDPNRQGSSFGAQRVGTYGSNPSQGSIFGPTNIGLAGSEDAMRGALTGSLNMLGQGNDQGRMDLQQAGAGANNTLNRYYDPGYRANDYQAALSGALGGQAQGQAFNQFRNSPGQQYLLNESERAIRRNAASTGGLGGGNVQRALQENAIGLAAQDFNNAFNRLGQVSDRGLGAGGQMAGNMMQTGGALANLTGQNAVNAANMIYGTGTGMAAGRTRAGEMIAGNVQTGSTNLADINTGTGQQLSNVQQQGASQLANLLAGYGRDDQAANTQLATLLANLATGTGSQVAGLPVLGSTQQTQGLINGSNLGNVAGGIGGLLGGAGAASGAGAGVAAMAGLPASMGPALLMSDRRLKRAIRKIGEHLGINIYSWEWNEIGQRLAGDQPTVGVIAQENPSATVVGPHGYLMVDYGRLFSA
jgi:hypothetical protein